MIDFSSIEPLASTLLREGLFLYPYRRSALKNQRNWTFGCLFPPAWTAGLGEPSWLQADCVLRGGPETRVAWRCRFLYQGSGVRSQGSGVSGQDDGKAVEGCLDFPPTALESGIRSQGSFVVRGQGSGVRSQGSGPEANWQVSADVVGPGLWRLRVRIDNVTRTNLPCPPRDEALMRALLSCHLLFGVEAGSFVSAIDPPPDCRAVSGQNVGVWPVLVGDPAAPRFMIAAPIILYDHPQIAPQSPVALGEIAEIDEMLRLRVLTLADHERQEATRRDDRARQIVEQVDAIGENEAGALRGVWRSGPQPGDRVRLKPARRADAFDFALAGRQAVVVSVDVDLEGKLHVGVVIDDDPGRDLGLAGWPGHRFYFAVEEVEPL